MPETDDPITPRVLLDHMQAMQRSLEGRIDANHAELKGEITELKGEIRRLDRKIDVLTAGVDQIDARLDAVEIDRLPDRVKALELRR